MQDRPYSLNAHLASLVEVVFPNPEDAPPLPPQNPVDPSISGFIRCELSFPKGTVTNRRVAMLHAAMPETAIYKYCHARLMEYKIWFSKYRLMASPASDVVATQEFHQRDFRPFVAAPANARHYYRPFRLGENVRHLKFNLLPPTRVPPSRAATLSQVFDSLAVSQRAAAATVSRHKNESGPPSSSASTPFQSQLPIHQLFVNRLQNRVAPAPTLRPTILLGYSPQ
jgi:hypothetical protein